MSAIQKSVEPRMMKSPRISTGGRAPKTVRKQRFGPQKERILRDIQRKLELRLIEDKDFDTLFSIARKSESIDRKNINQITIDDPSHFEIVRVMGMNLKIHTNSAKCNCLDKKTTILI